MSPISSALKADAETDSIDSLDSLDVVGWADYLTPKQRVTAVAEILAAAALRILKERHENDLS